MKNFSIRLPLFWLMALSGIICLYFDDKISYASLLGFVLVAYTLQQFLSKIQHSVPLAETTLLIAGLQWIVVPYFSYGNGIGFEHFEMQVPLEFYMNNTVLAYAGFFCGLNLSIPEIKLSSSYYSSLQISFWKCILKIGIGLFLISFIYSNFVISLWPWFLLSYLLCKINYENNKKKYYLWLASLNIYLFLKSLSQGMFHEVLLFSLFQFIYLGLILRIKRRQTIMILLGTVIFINVLQQVKSDYRRHLNDNVTSIENITLFVNLIDDSLRKMFNQDKTIYVSSTSNTLARFNQGWLISAVYRCNDGNFHPELFPVFLENIIAIVIPRFLLPNKRQGGGRANIKMFTDLKIAGETSMNISTVGEGYCYFGCYGNAVFHCLLGMLFAAVVRIFMYWEKTYYAGVFLLPPVFFLAVRAESDFMTGYTPIFKVTVLIALLIFFNFQRKSQNPSNSFQQRDLQS